MTNEPTIESREIYRGKVLNLRVDTVRLPNGKSSPREIVEHEQTVVVVPVNHQGNVLLVRQYRKAAERPLLEAPAGGLDAGEAPEEGAQRELQEETGFKAGQLDHMASFWTTPGFCTEYMHAYLASGLERGDLSPEDDESIEVVEVPWDRVGGMIRSGEIEDAKTIAVLLLAAQASDGVK